MMMVTLKQNCTQALTQSTYLEALQPETNRGGVGVLQWQARGGETEEQAMLAVSNQDTLHIYDQPVPLV